MMERVSISMNVLLTIIVRSPAKGFKDIPIGSHGPDKD